MLFYAKTSAARPQGFMGDTFLAGASPQQVQLGRTINGWGQQLNNPNGAVRGMPPAQNKAAPVNSPQPNALPTYVQTPRIIAGQTNPAMQLINLIAPPGSTIIQVPGIDLPRQLSFDDQKLRAITTALTPNMNRAFANLDDDRLKVIARTMMLLALKELQAGQIKPQDFSFVVGRILATVKAMQLPNIETGRDIVVPSATFSPSEVPNKTTLDSGQRAPWSDERIAAAVRKMALAKGITSEKEIAFLTDFLIHPNAMSYAERARSLGRSVTSVANIHSRDRELLGIKIDDERAALAKLIIMPAAEVVARIGKSETKGEVSLGQRVLAQVPETHRERVAERILAMPIRAKSEAINLNTLHHILTVDIHFGGPLDNTGPAKALRETFGFNRLEMLHEVFGFSYERIISVNPTGKAVMKRLDPALGTFSSSEKAIRTKQGLPNTREEAALRMLTAYESNNSTSTISYRKLVCLALISDRRASDGLYLNERYLTKVPKGNPEAGGNDRSSLLRIAENQRGKPFGRLHRTQITPQYTQDRNTQVLQVFGLGYRDGRGALVSIPTNFTPAESPSSTNKVEQSLRGKKEEGGLEPIGWNELLPLLKK